jgi:uncharacterized protein
MRCPTCEVDLSIADRQGIELDYCPRCRGVWLDRGELDKLIALAAIQTSATRVANDARYPGDRHRDDYQRPREKKSWISRLMDFD